MSWEMLALLTAVMYGLQSIVMRGVMKDESSVAYAWLFNMLSLVFFLPLAAADFSIPVSATPWIMAIVAGLLWAINGVVGMEAYKHTEVSLKAPLSKIGLPFILVLSVIILSETLTPAKIAGVGLITAGAVVLTWEKGLFGKLSHKGVRLTIAAEALFVIIAVTEKATVQHFSAAAYGFIAFLIPALILLPMGVRNFSAVKRLAGKKSLVLVSVLLGVAGYLSHLTAYKLTDISNVMPIVELSVIVSVAGGYLFHREKEFKKRLAGTAIMIIGSVLILRPGLL